jgi:hypothetical protein
MLRSHFMLIMITLAHRDNGLDDMDMCTEKT